MIITLAGELEAFEALGIQEVCAALDGLLDSHRRGHHVVVIRRALVDWLLEKGCASPSGVATLRRIRQDFSQTGDLARRAGIVLTLHPSPSRYRPRPNEEVLSISDFARLPLNEPATVLLENAHTDGKLYRLMIELIGRRIGIPAIAMNVAHGGGEDIITQFRRLTHEGRAVVCSADRDTFRRDGGDSAKVRSLRRVLEEEGWRLARLFVTPGREVENFLPLSIFRELPCWHTNPSRDLFLQVATHCGEYTGIGFWFDVDLKNGLSEGEWNQLSDRERQLISEALRRGGHTRNPPKVAGFGDRIVQCWMALPHGIALLAEVMKTTEWRNAFAEFFELFCWFFAGRPRMVV